MGTAANGSVPKRAAPKKAAAPKKEKPPTPEALVPKVTSIVESQRQLGGSAYPVPFVRLIELVGHESVLARKAIAAAVKKGSVVSSLKLATKGGDADESVLIAVAQDATVLAGSPALLKLLLEMNGTKEASALDAAVLSKGVAAALVKPFHAALSRLTPSTLPEGVGSVSVSTTKRVFFLLDHAWMGRSAGPVATSRSADATSNGVDVDFAERFANAFDALNQAQGEQNYVLVHDLRRQLPSVSRQDFDRGLNALRRAKTFTLDSTDGRYTRLTREQLDAGVEEAGRLLVYVARRAP